jgi:hypothetical protein
LIDLATDQAYSATTLIRRAKREGYFVTEQACRATKLTDLTTDQAYLATGQATEIGYLVSGIGYWVLRPAKYQIVNSQSRMLHSELPLLAAGG